MSELRRQVSQPARKPPAARPVATRCGPRRSRRSLLRSLLRLTGSRRPAPFIPARWPALPRAAWSSRLAGHVVHRSPNEGSLRSPSLRSDTRSWPRWRALSRPPCRDDAREGRATQANAVSRVAQVAGEACGLVRVDRKGPLARSLPDAEAQERAQRAMSAASPGAVERAGAFLQVWGVIAPMAPRTPRTGTECPRPTVPSAYWNSTRASSSASTSRSISSSVL